MLYVFALGSCGSLFDFNLILWTDKDEWCKQSALKIKKKWNKIKITHTIE